MAVSGSAVDPTFEVIVEVEAAFTFASAGGARRAVRMLRRGFRASVGIRRGESGAKEWEVVARLPAMRFELERVRTLAQDLDELADRLGGELVTWEAVRPHPVERARAGRAMEWLSRRWLPIASVDVIIGVIGALLAETVVVASAVTIAMVQGGVWALAKRRTG
jgi:hypothetical protein